MFKNGYIYLSRGIISVKGYICEVVSLNYLHDNDLIKLELYF